MNWTRFISIMEQVGVATLTLIKPEYAQIATAIIGMVSTAEVAGVPGPQKLNAVMSSVPMLISGVNAAAGSQIVNPALAADLPAAISSVITVVNEIGKPKALAAAA